MSSGRKLLLGVVVLVLCALPTAHVSGQPGDRTLQVTFTPHTDVVLPRGLPGAWDAGFVVPGDVIYADGQFHLFYTGGESYATHSWAIGYAVSRDGIHWVKSINNPIIERCRSPFDCGLMLGAVLFDDGEWIAYLNPHRAPGIMPGREVSRATAASPTGPWTIDSEPVLEGARGTWEHYVTVDDAVRTPEGIRLYYTGWDRYLIPQIGLATAPDGIQFEKHREESALSFTHCTPVLAPQQGRAWDNASVQASSVMVTENGWDLLYYGVPEGETNTAGLRGIGYATSEDGIHWLRYCDNPVLTLDESVSPWMPVAVQVEGTTYLFYAVRPHDTLNFEVGLAEGTIVRE